MVLDYVFIECGLFLKIVEIALLPELTATCVNRYSVLVIRFISHVTHVILPFMVFGNDCPTCCSEVL